ncbi:AI-2E family transporter [Yoonia sediminilitoris]|uniref:Putative PurR-regulated permease PerM n=1 Tax=Yoonia sediminilitoris TaxID=1286148 RepID=A0A2T6KQ53_9RHOB|nr:AI-2E family transporter [Yoonia sediminilitoris]PUB18682.1 putative PurR-regulated permease PerM [Yoonia sediminilitoris]RCW98850.1 putative PurR-regulated permease PerM [Yoonia sediminilitoris]
MALPVGQQAKYWGIAVGVFLVVMWFLGDVILPFVLGGAIAYCLDPIADRLEKAGLSRVSSVAVITLVAALLFILLFLLVIPTLVQQTAALIDTAPELFNRLQAGLTERFPSLVDEQSTIRQQLIKIGETIQSKGGELINGLLSSAFGLLNVLILLIVVPVVAFYMLLDWDNMTAKIDSMLPRDHVDTIRQLARDIDKTLASFIRGQGTVCLILGTYYAAGLMLAGLKFGLIVGFIAGLITFIPYVGALVGGVLAVGLALFQFWGAVEITDGDVVTNTTNWVRIGIVAGIFGFGQFLEGNILTPKLVGGSVGLHPVWLLFALSVFGSLFGFVGMLVAVPLAAMLGVLARYGLDRYKDSLLYRGRSGSE